ncbi:MAG: UbiA-like polyprenyltransferase [Phycisphaerales bacterium]
MAAPMGDAAAREGAGADGSGAGPGGAAVGAGWLDRVRIALGDIKLAHSVFALPFAVIGAVVARARSADGGTAWWSFFVGIVLVCACMVAARTWAMLVNRLADHRFDAANPRTAGRAVASGRLGVREGWAMALVSAGLFVVLAGGFWVALGNAWPLALSVPVLGWIALYSYTKRFTALCHLFLGSALALSPLAAAIAMNPEVVFGWTATGSALVTLSGFVMLWVGGFDVAYALQDLAFDRERGLRSVPSALGVGGALWVSRGLHAGALVCLAGFVWREPSMGALAWAGWAAVGCLLVWEHAVLARRGVAGLPLAFFTLNGVVSCLFGVLAVTDGFVGV